MHKYLSNETSLFTSESTRKQQAAALWMRPLCLSEAYVPVTINACCPRLSFPSARHSLVLCLPSIAITCIITTLCYIATEPPLHCCIFPSSVRLVAVCQERLIAQLFGFALYLPVALPLHFGCAETFHYLPKPQQDCSSYSTALFSYFNEQESSYLDMPMEHIHAYKHCCVRLCWTIFFVCKCS